MTNINLYLDDNRPAPPGWTLIKSGTKLVNFYQDHETIDWRKSNAIHHWFVENVQDDNDDCGSYCVTIESLEELRDICQNVIDKHDNTYSQEVLPTEAGFFFGDTDINQYYYEDVKRTADALNKELLLTKKIAGTKLEIEYSYQASW